MARPTIYTEDLAINLLTKIVEGKSLVSICSDEAMPSLTTVYRWLTEDEKFRDTYARAKEDQADTLADEMLDIADEQCTIVKHGDGDAEKDVEVVFDSVAVARNRLRVDTRKWIASKLKAKKYGDKVELDTKVEHSGEVKHSVGFEGSAEKLLDQIRAG